MRDTTAKERAAMWLYSSEYANQTKSAIEFYRGLTDSRKALVDEMISDIVERLPKNGIHKTAHNSTSPKLPHTFLEVIKHLGIKVHSRSVTESAMYSTARKVYEYLGGNFGQ